MKWLHMKHATELYLISISRSQATITATTLQDAVVVVVI